ncbi:MAG: NAD(P)-dependent oxidoreductase [Anaerolineales bacterium]
MQERVGFIGLGQMGSGMVPNLLAAEVDLTIWNRTGSKMEPFLSKGAKAAKSPQDLAEKCDIVLLCVSDTPDVRELIAGAGGLLQGLSQGDLVVDHSTISPQATRELAQRLSQKGVHMLDAPISGGSEGAADGTLSIMVGGDTAQFERAEPLFKVMGKTITHVGGNGDGQMVKLVNQILVVGHALAMSEALVFAAAGGLDLERALQAVSGGAAGSWMLSNRGPQILADDWTPGFTIDLQQKDVNLALGEAERLGVPTFSTSIVASLYRTLQRRGMGDQGNHALIKALEQLAEVRARAD